MLYKNERKQFVVLVISCTILIILTVFWKMYENIIIDIIFFINVGISLTIAFWLFKNDKRRNRDELDKKEVE